MTRLELQIEDYVWCKDRDTGIKHACEVIGLLLNGRISIWFKSHHVDVCGNEIEPIPLTPEILEKNGFEHEENEEKWWHWNNLGVKNGNEYIDIAFRDDNAATCDVEITKGFNTLILHLDYVHQLQHALRLCDIIRKIIL